MKVGKSKSRSKSRSKRKSSLEIQNPSSSSHHIIHTTNRQPNKHTFIYSHPIYSRNQGRYV